MDENTKKQISNCLSCISFCIPSKATSTTPCQKCEIFQHISMNIEDQTLRNIEHRAITSDRAETHALIDINLKMLFANSLRKWWVLYLFLFCTCICICCVVKVIKLSPHPIPAKVGEYV